MSGISTQARQNSLYFFAPGMKHYDAEGFSISGTCGLSAVSVTGARCDLNCKHCGASILRSMKPALTSEMLRKEAEKAAAHGAPGLLVSGGSLKNGSVPYAPFMHALKEIKRDLKLNVLVHTGLVTPAIADGLAEAHVDCAMIDIIGDNETIRKVCRLDAKVEDFERSLNLLISRGIPTAPHVIIGLDFGIIKGEERALKLISDYPVRAVVLVGFRPIPGTPMGNAHPATPLEMGAVFTRARALFPDTPVLLGCERPLGPHREQTDRLALEAGLDGIAFPSEPALEWAAKRDIPSYFSRNCCAMVPAVKQQKQSNVYGEE